jgi:hypothetical protein
MRLSSTAGKSTSRIAQRREGDAAASDASPPHAIVPVLGRWRTA